MTYNPLDHIILRTEVGSTAYGTGLPGHEDLDHMAVCVESKAQTIGLEQFDHLIHRPGRGPQEPSGPGDLDLTVYSLRKWARLALKGNPSVLMLLFGPIVSMKADYARPLLDLRSMFATRHAQNAFLGYMQQQRERMQGTRGAAGRIRRNPDAKCTACGGTGKDPVIVALNKLGGVGLETCGTCRGVGLAVDWKYAMHMIRLGYQGFIYCQTGHISVPIIEPMRSRLIDIRQGKVSLDDVIHEATVWEQKLKALDLPPDPPFKTVQSVVMDIYQTYWEETR